MDNLIFPAEYPYNTRMTSKKQTENRLELALVKQMLTLATSGFGLVAALAWNSAIGELINTYVKPFLPQGSGLISLLVYAILVTIVAVIITFNLSKVIEKLER
jgi:uncharacterized membrane protein (DUF106 family)